MPPANDEQESAIRSAVSTAYDRMAVVYEKRWRRYVHRSVTETIRHVDVQPGERLLDVGCGTGAFLTTVGQETSATRMGIDLSVGMLARARRHLDPHVGLSAADAERLPFAAATFDVVVSLSSFHFWADPAAALVELRRVLRPGGRLVLTDWCDDFFACRVCDLYLRWRDPAHRRIFGQDACREMPEASGFRSIRIERYKISWLWGLMTAVAENAN